jgi:quinol monooxygenase YgiN
MTIKEEHVAEYIAFTASLKAKIKAFDGCQFLDILQDVNNRNLLFSYSLWDTEEHLDLYRASKFFKETWATIKPWFDDKPEAWSTEML